MGFVHRNEAPLEAISWFRQAAELADTVDSAWTAGICRSELSLLLSLYGDPGEAISLINDQFRIFRRAGDLGRARSAVRMAIPALHRLLDAQHLVDLVILDSGTADRPQIREPFNETAVEHVIEQIKAKTDADAIVKAVTRGRASTDEAVAELALELIDEAMVALPSPAHAKDGTSTGHT